MMKKIITLFAFIISIFLILINSYEIMESISFSFSLCINNLFPSLIPFILLSNILIEYDFINDINDILKVIITKIFKVNKNCSFAFVMSILSGTPSNAKYLKDLLDNKLITVKDCNKCLIFLHFTNPIFVIGTIGLIFFNNKRIGLIILICHYISTLIIGFFNRNSSYSNLNPNNFNKNFIIKEKKFISILKNSINNTINTLLLILGIITTCIIITCILDNIFFLDNDFKFIYGFIEMTQGLKYLSLSDLSIKLKASISSFLISFGGLCIHAQVFSILDDKKIRYLPYLISRIVHGLISFILTTLAMNLIG